MICWSFCLQCLTFFVEHQSKHSTFHQLINYTQDIFVIIFDFYNDRKEAIQENLLEVTKCTFFIKMYEIAPLRCQLSYQIRLKVYIHRWLRVHRIPSTQYPCERGHLQLRPPPISNKCLWPHKKGFFSHSVILIIYMEFTHVLLHSGLLGGICGPLHRG